MYAPLSISTNFTAIVATLIHCDNIDIIAIVDTLQYHCNNCHIDIGYGIIAMLTHCDNIDIAIVATDTLQYYYSCHRDIAIILLYCNNRHVDTLR